MIIKTPAEIEQMRVPCQLTASILDQMEDFVKPGISTKDIDTRIHEIITSNDAVPATLNYNGFPASCCTSINEVICHGIPSSLCILKEGDIVNIDVTCIKNGFFGDASRMYFVGGAAACAPEVVELVEATRASLYEAIALVKPGRRIGAIGAEIQRYINGLKRGYGIVREYTGHGIGRQFHEPPQVLHYYHKGFSEMMKPGMTFTIEPMINLGTHKTVLDPEDKWTVRTVDGKWSAQWEHTLAVTEDGVDILTRSQKDGEQEYKDLLAKVG